MLWNYGSTFNNKKYYKNKYNIVYVNIKCIKKKKIIKKFDLKLFFL